MNTNVFSTSMIHLFSILHAAIREYSCSFVAEILFFTSLFDLPRPPQCAARLRSCVLAVFQYMRAIDEHVFHAGGELMRLLEGGAIGDGLRVEDDDVGED